jgi:hypothetical protein
VAFGVLAELMAEPWRPSMIDGTADMRLPPVIGSSLRTACAAAEKLLAEEVMAW